VATLPGGDLSGELRGRLGVREYLALRDAGISTIEDLATREVGDLLTADYVQNTKNVRGAKTRLRKAVISAQLARDEAVLRLSADVDVNVPTAEVEVDLDTEWSAGNYVYLWVRS
jgi:predicted RecB family nuclease